MYRTESVPFSCSNAVWSRVSPNPASCASRQRALRASPPFNSLHLCWPTPNEQVLTRPAVACNGRKSLRDVSLLCTVLRCTGCCAQSSDCSVLLWFFKTGLCRIVCRPRSPMTSTAGEADRADMPAHRKKCYNMLRSPMFRSRLNYSRSPKQMRGLGSHKGDGTITRIDAGSKKVAPLPCCRAAIANAVLVSA